MKGIDWTIINPLRGFPKKFSKNLINICVGSLFFL